MATRPGAGPPPRGPGRPHRARPSARSRASSCLTTCRSSTPWKRPRASTAPCTPASATAARASSRRRGDLRRAADVLNAGKKVAMLVGAGALHADRRSHRHRRPPRRRRRQGAARQGRRSRRPALRHRSHRAARHQTKLGHDDGLRHAAHGRYQLSVLGIPPQGRPGARRPDRRRPTHARHPLPRWK